jgi:hypothetical protein
VCLECLLLCALEPYSLGVVVKVFQQLFLCGLYLLFGLLQLGKRKSKGFERTTTVAGQVGRLSRRVYVNLTKVL